MQFVWELTVLLSVYFVIDSCVWEAVHLPSCAQLQVCQSLQNVGECFFKITYLEVAPTPVGQVAAGANKNIS